MGINGDYLYLRLGSCSRLDIESAVLSFGLTQADTYALSPVDQGWLTFSMRRVGGALEIDCRLVEHMAALTKVTSHLCAMADICNAAHESVYTPCEGWRSLSFIDDERSFRSPLVDDPDLSPPDDYAYRWFEVDRRPSPHVEVESGERDDIDAPF